MLTDQRLRYTQRVDQFMHTTLRFPQLQHDGDAYRCGQRTQQLAGGVENSEFVNLNEAPSSGIY